jgi:hypothetical protein
VPSRAPAAGSEAGDSFFPWKGTRDVPADSAISLRHLNERRAGEHGFIAMRDGRFVHGDTGEPVRFWAVNGPSPHATSDAQLAAEARLLAAYGVNLVRIHGAVFDARGETDPARVAALRRMVRALAAEGIYSHLSIYFPLWFKPPADLEWLPGYDGKRFPFATLMFNEAFQHKYQSWWRDLLTSDPDGSGPLIAEPALMGVEVQNEDSFFFWTFNQDNIPDPQLRLLEGLFARWVAAEHGSLDRAMSLWGSPPLARDALAEGRLGFRPLWAMANERTARDRDTAAFLYDVQARFYREQVAHLRSLGFRGLTTASNWTTAHAAILGPLEKASYLEGDFIDRHGYFGSGHKGESAEWSIRVGHTYRDRSALRFETEAPGDGRDFVHPVMDIEYNGRPSMISETTWCRPNRHRGEAPLYLAAYGALQGTDSIVHFAFDGSGWEVKPNFWMQQWTLMTPAMMGQFPAAALIYRRGLVEEGAVLADIKLSLEELKALGGTPLPQDASFDELRRADLPGEAGRGERLERLDPLIHYAGRTRVDIGTGGASVVAPLDKLIDREARSVTSAGGQLRLDYGRGLLRIDAPAAQGVSGALGGETHVLPAFELHTAMSPGHVVLVALDGRPIARSGRLLLQVMSEERASGFQTEAVADGRLRITDCGRDPWEVRRLQGRVSLRLARSAITVRPLDAMGRPAGRSWRESSWDLEPETVYYLIEVAASGDAGSSP